MVLIVNSDSMGKGDEELGKRLMESFVRKLWAWEKRPESILLYNSGIKLLATGSSLLLEFQGLAEAGVEILACGTCVDFFGLRDQIQVGTVSNMQEILARVMEADHVVTV